MLHLAERLQALRRELGWTQEDVAQRMRVSPQSVSKWERGESCPDIALLPGLASLFHTSIDYLMGMDHVTGGEERAELFRRAHGLFDAGEYAAAAEALREAGRRYPSDAAISSELAYCLAFLPAGLPEAIGLCEEVLRAMRRRKTGTPSARRCVFCMKRRGSPTRPWRWRGSCPTGGSAGRRSPGR